MTIAELVQIDDAQQRAALDILRRKSAESKQAILDKVLANATLRMKAMVRKTA